MWFGTSPHPKVRLAITGGCGALGELPRLLLIDRSGRLGAVQVALQHRYDDQLCGDLAAGGYCCTSEQSISTPLR